MRRLETHYRDLCDIEFTVERGKLWMLQTRVGKRTAGAAFRIATQLVDEQVITRDEALTRVTGHQLAQLMFPQFDADAPARCSRRRWPRRRARPSVRSCSTPPPPSPAPRRAAGSCWSVVRPTPTTSRA
ncbi:PEP/pyruvate-binding domain-containing protein [Pseudonocardia benzenivorans]